MFKHLIAQINTCYPMFISTVHYEISYQAAKNRLYISIKGFWRNKADVASYLPDLKKILQKTKPGFTLLTDLRAMKTSPPEMQEIHIAAQKALVDAGLHCTAEVVASSFVQFQASQYSKTSEMPLKQFESKAAAEAFLDTLKEPALA
ncbi:hypothetical protein QWY31_10155 [Cytophagales bacterium LB-30]|uniref:Uncharacterized protein n=1 Tax=Shiella aurantiaca TaxID=3058365 RepID=A0ABT8F5W8_9BACT|nr:hypothetical protein [Shiella aurantiaca]MDN4165868.1 hypothetical protein [Shiella aurantiaca]